MLASPHSCSEEIENELFPKKGFKDMQKNHVLNLLLSFSKRKWE